MEKAKKKSFRKEKRMAVLKFVCVALAFAMVVLACFFLLNSSTLILIICFLSFAVLGVAIAFIDEIKREAIFKSLVVTFFTVTAIFLIYLILQLTGVLARVQNAEQMAELIRSTGWIGALVFIAFVLLNTIFLPIPAAVTAVVGALVFGPLLAFIYMSIGTVIGAVIIFSAGKIFGKKIVIWILGKEKTEKWSEFLNKKGKLAFIFMIIFPFFPDDVLCLVAGVSTMSYRFFIFVICSVRVATLAFMTFLGDGRIIPFSGWGIYVWIAIGAVMVAAFITATVVQNRMLKKTKAAR